LLSFKNNLLKLNDMIEIKAAQIRENIFKLISKDWMLVTAGNSESFNTMTANWGFMGEMWGQDMVEIVIRCERFTREFIDREKRFTLTFVPDEMTKVLELMGSQSGRNFDKMHYAGLQPETLPSGQISFSGAKMVLECEVVYRDPLKPGKFIDSKILQDWYGKEKGGMHIRYYARITKVWLPDDSRPC